MICDEYLMWCIKKNSASTIHFLFDSSLSTTDEKRAIGQLVTGFVRKIDYGRDFEKQLNFYVEARAMFCNLDAVLVCLVQARLSIFFPIKLFGLLPPSILAFQHIIYVHLFLCIVSSSQTYNLHVVLQSIHSFPLSLLFCSSKLCIFLPT